MISLKRRILEKVLPVFLAGSLSSGIINADETVTLDRLLENRVVETRGTNWKQPLELGGLYEEIASDLRESKPLIISTYAGLWPDGTEAESNLHWGNYYGPFTMFDRAGTDSHIAGNFEYHDWERVAFEKNEEDPVRTAVFRMSVEPNDFWRERGVDEEFDVYHVLQGYGALRVADFYMSLNLKRDIGSVIETREGNIDLRNARIIGYNGHNFHYDLSNDYFDTLNNCVMGTPDRKKGVFVIGCNTKRFFRDELIDNNIYGVAFTTSFMAPEGYNLLALTDGLIQGLSGEELADKMDRSYRYFQVLGGQQRTGPLFVNHSKGLY